MRKYESELLADRKGAFTVLLVGEPSWAGRSEGSFCFVLPTTRLGYQFTLEIAGSEHSLSPDVGFVDGKQKKKELLFSANFFFESHFPKLTLARRVVRCHGRFIRLERERWSGGGSAGSSSQQLSSSPSAHAGSVFVASKPALNAR